MSDIKGYKISTEDRFKSLFKNIPIPTYAWQIEDNKLVLIDFNFAAGEITEGKIKNYLGIKASELYNDVPEILEDLNRCAKEKINISKEMKYYMKSTGKTKFLSVKYGFVPPDLVIVHTEDVTEQKQAEERLKDSEKKLRELNLELEQKIAERTRELRESESNYRNIIENMGEGYFEVNLKGEFTFFNETHRSFLGYVREELLGLNYGKFIEKSKLKEIINKFNYVYENDLPVDYYEVELLKSDGQIRIIEGSIHLKYDSDGNKIGFFSITRDISDRRLIERKLIESEQQYRSFVENFQGIAFRGHQDFSAAFFHGAVEEITGYTENAFLFGKAKWDQLIHPDDVQNVQKSVEKFHSTPMKKARREYRIIDRSGRPHWVLENIQKIFDEHRNEEVVLGTVEDITTRKNAEQKLKESELKYKNLSSELETILDIIPGMMFCKDKNDKVTRVNQNFADALKLTKEDIIGKTTFDLFPKEQAEAFRRDDLEVINSGKPKLNIEETGDFPEGKVWVITNKIPQFSEHGEVIGLVGLSIDITERKKIEQKLKESEEKFRLAFENASDAIVWADAESGIIINVNKAAEVLLERSKEELIGQLHTIIHPVEDADLHKKKFKEDVKKKASVSQDTKLLSKSGKVIPMLLSAALIQIGEKPVMQGIFRDMSEKKKLEKLKSDLVRRTSHELKTPLISIKGYADLLLNLHYHKLDSDMISIIDEIKDGCIRLENLIKDLLETSKLESSQVELKTNREDLSFLIRFCVRDLKGLIDAKKHKIDLDIHDELVSKFEKEKIYEVLNNLLSNAIKYTLPNGLIKLKTEIDKDFYVISVEDNGVGFNNEEKDIIFKQFGKIERFGQGWNIETGGTGLGLYISKKIVELHGGKIWMKSKGRNKGSTFYFSIPIIKD